MLDTLIRGAKIVDGTGKAAFTADVGILDGMIEAVGIYQVRRRSRPSRPRAAS